jgi:transcriptional regulator with XRE-family HTH domain
MPNFTYLPGPEDPETVSTCGFSFTAGEWTPVPGDHAAVEKLRGNRFFAEQGMATNGKISPADSEGDSAELHDCGDAAMKGNERIPARARDASVSKGAAVEITPLQCRAARAGLEWSREHLAELAKIGERTVTDFERHASNMLRSKKAAVRKAFEAAGVTFDGSNGIWFTEPAKDAENSAETALPPEAHNQSAEVAETEGEPLAA